MASPEITLTHLDEPLFEGAGATKPDLVDPLVADRIVPVLSGRPLSVIRVRAGQRPFMQKNVPHYAPPWIKTVSVWAESWHRDRRSYLVLDIDPPAAGEFGRAVAAAKLVREALSGAGRPRDDRVHQGRSRRHGVHRLDPGARRDRGGRLQPASAPWRAGLIPGGLGFAGRGIARGRNAPL
jgi:DNA primase